MRTWSRSLVSSLIGCVALAAPAQGIQVPAKTARVCAVSLSWADRDRSLRHALELLDQAAAQRAEIVCLPQECVPTDGGESARIALTAIAQKAAQQKLYVVANLQEREAERVYLTSYLIGPEGTTVGKYRKSHRLPDEPIALGDELPVFDTSFGNVGRLVGTDHYWPEIPLVMATDDEYGQRTLALVAEKAQRYKTYIIIGGLRDPELPYRNGDRASWAYLWDRSGKVAGKYRISQYGDSTTLPVFQTDFGVIGISICGDTYSQEISRALAVQGAEIIFCPSQSWGPSGTINLWMQQARAIDNGVYLAAAHLPMSDAGQRSYVLDPYGQVLAGSAYWSDSVCTADVDLAAGQVWFARSNTPGRAGTKGYLADRPPEVVSQGGVDAHGGPRALEEDCVFGRLARLQ